MKFSKAFNALWYSFLLLFWVLSALQYAGVSIRVYSNENIFIWFSIAIAIITVLGYWIESILEFFGVDIDKE